MPLPARTAAPRGRLPAVVGVLLGLAGGAASIASPAGLGLASGIGLAPAAPGPAAAPGLILAAEPALAPGPARESGAWAWPVTPAVVTREFLAPPHRYGAGHRGVDLRPAGGDTTVRAPADGVVAFVGRVVDRDVLTIDHGGGVVSSYEPIASGLAVGAAVRRGEPIGRISLGGHAEPGTVHLGVRVDGDYVDPRLLLGSPRRAILLPCC